jgi:hypothetical protein
MQLIVSFATFELFVKSRSFTHIHLRGFSHSLINCTLILMSRYQHRGPTLAVVECPNLDIIKTSISALSEFPCIQVACNARDSHYQVCAW